MNGRTRRNLRKVSDKQKKRDLWDILQMLTPLIIGIAVTGVGTFATYLINNDQAKHNKKISIIKFLNEMRPQLFSDDPRESEFAFAAFLELDEEIALRIIKASNAKAAKPAVKELQENSDVKDRQLIKDTLKKLDELSDFNVAIFYYSDDSESKKLANEIEKKLKSNEEFKGIVTFRPSSKSLLDSLAYDNTENEIRYEKDTEKVAKAELRSQLKKYFPNDEFEPVLVRNKTPNYISVFLKRQGN